MVTYCLLLAATVVFTDSLMSSISPASQVVCRDNRGATAAMLLFSYSHKVDKTLSTVLSVLKDVDFLFQLL